MNKRFDLRKYYLVLKGQFAKYFLANEDSNEKNQKKQNRLAKLVIICAMASLAGIFVFGDKKEEKEPEEKPDTQGFEVDNLAKGVSYEEMWMKQAGQVVEGVKQKQEMSEKKHEQIVSNLEKSKIGREELDIILNEQKKQLQEEFDRRLQEENGKLMKEQESLKNEVANMGYAQVHKKTNYQFGKYVPAGSHVKAVLISGVDAGIGISSEADPRHVLMRITGSVTSAGFGAEPMRTKVLIGCMMQGTVVGDISSEKAYIKPTVMTCAKKPNTVIEVPIKGYVISQGKSGVRGQVISREGDLVLKSFLSGAISGMGTGVSRSTEPTIKLSGGTLSGEKPGIKDIFKGGISEGIGSSSDRLSDYFIKKAEQYQPVISIDEGTIIDIVFQEGFSLEEVQSEK